MFLIFILTCKKYQFKYTLNSYNRLSLTLYPINTFDKINIELQYINYFKLFSNAIKEMKKYRKGCY